ncbi:unnamed protein product, partial [Amoebophrya sp. A25]|eukprot:GSA25T00006359001.1
MGGGDRDPRFSEDEEIQLDDEVAEDDILSRTVEQQQQNSRTVVQLQELRGSLGGSATSSVSGSSRRVANQGLSGPMGLSASTSKLDQMSLSMSSIANDNDGRDRQRLPDSHVGAVERRRRRIEKEHARSLDKITGSYSAQGLEHLHSHFGVDDVHHGGSQPPVWTSFRAKENRAHYLEHTRKVKKHIYIPGVRDENGHQTVKKVNYRNDGRSAEDFARTTLVDSVIADDGSAQLGDDVTKLAFRNSRSFSVGPNGEMKSDPLQLRFESSRAMEDRKKGTPKMKQTNNLAWNPHA